jgi:hypothetical protein
MRGCNDEPLFVSLNNEAASLNVVKIEEDWGWRFTGTRLRHFCKRVSGEEPWAVCEVGATPQAVSE